MKPVFVPVWGWLRKTAAAPFGLSWPDWGRTYVTAAKYFVADDVLTYAAALTFYFGLSFIPLVLLLMSMGGFILENIASGLAGEDELYRQILDYLHNFFPFLQLETVNWLGLLVKSRHSLGIIGALSLLLSATAAFGALEQALKRIYGARQLHFVLQRLLMAVLVFGLGFLLAVSIFFTTLLTELLGRYVPFLLQVKETVSSFPVVAYMTPLLFIVLAFVVIMKYFLGRDLGWRSTFAGGVVFAAFFTIARLAYKIYLGKLSNLNAVYGSLTAIIAMIVWVYYIISIFLYSAEFIKTLRERQLK